MSEKICVSCGCIIENDDYYTPNGDVYCEDCFHEDFKVCWHCGTVEHMDDMIYIESEERWVCDNCENRYYFYCDCCNEHYHNELGQWLENDYVCEDCFERNAYYCSNCNEYVWENHWNFDADCCEMCAEDMIIGGYHTHNFFKVGASCVEKNIFHKGVELEIENKKDYITNDSMATMISELYNHIVFETDGSLDHGFEIITQPHTFETFANIPWERILDLCSEKGFRSHDTSTCGLHIHYSREFFGMNPDEREDNIGKVIAFYERNIDTMLRLSRRTFVNYLHWAHGYDTEGDVEKCKECAKKRNDRYHYINMNNYATIEFRLGRGTLNYNSFMAWNNLHDCLVKNVKNVSYEDIDNLEVWFEGITQDTLEYFDMKNCFMDYVRKYRKEV